MTIYLPRNISKSFLKKVILWTFEDTFLRCGWLCVSTDPTYHRQKIFTRKLYQYWTCTDFFFISS
jgi:hypothetical protein